MDLVPGRVVGVSLKMYLDQERTRAWLGEVARIGRRVRAGDFGPAPIELFVLPTFLGIRDAHRVLAGSGVGIGAQNVSWAESGALTGEVPASALRSEGCRYAEVGHAERRRLFGEDDDMTARKAAAASRAGLVPVVCVGELKRSEPGTALAQCLPQALAVLAALRADAELIFAYEPVWAIGADEPASAGHVVEVVSGLREVLPSRPGLTRFIYGGSAGPGTFDSLAPVVDGLFLGRFAHDPANLRQVLTEVGRALQRTANSSNGPTSP